MKMNTGRGVGSLSLLIRDRQWWVNHVEDYAVFLILQRIVRRTNRLLSARVRSELWKEEVESGGIWPSGEVGQSEAGKDNLSPCLGDGFGPRSAGQESLA